MFASKSMLRAFDNPKDYKLKRNILQAIKFFIYQVFRFVFYGAIVVAILTQVEISADGYATRSYLVLLNIWLTILISWSFTILYRVVTSKKPIIAYVIAVAYTCFAIYLNIAIIDRYYNSTKGLMITPILSLLVAGFLSMFKNGQPVSVIIKDD